MTQRLDALPPFPTAVIGSLPRPAWLVDVEKRKVFAEEAEVARPPNSRHRLAASRRI